MRIPSAIVAFLLFSTTALAAEPPLVKDVALEKSIAGSWRSPQMVQRDQFRHPLEELEFFGIRPTMTVVEIWPVSGYWAEILAPYLQDHGIYYAAAFPDVPERSEGKSSPKFLAKLEADKAAHGKVTFTSFGRGYSDIAPAGSVDMVLTFRNLHNWMVPPAYTDEALVAFYKALKPGGILGMEEHRGRNDRPQDPAAASGYVRQDYAIQLAEKAGFKFVGSSEINANPKDTTDWPKGVWTLPPTLALGAQDRDKYLAIGEADNFVLKFQKPAS